MKISKAGTRNNSNNDKMAPPLIMCMIRNCLLAMGRFLLFLPHSFHRAS